MGALQEKTNARLRPVLFSVLLLCVTLQQTESSGTGWNYVDRSVGGPGNWSQTYPKCAGSMQSPIDINTTEVVYNRKIRRFDTSDYSTTDGLKLTLENVGGHTAELVLSGAVVQLKGGSLPGNYTLDQLHFHWGSNDSRGSEHSIDGIFFPMEVHFVHHQNLYANASEAAPQSYGLAVLSFVFQVGDNNAFFDQLIAYLDRIPNPNDEVKIPTFKLSDLIPRKFDFYRYYGSLTTPPCYESVIWSIGTEPITISEQQLEKFRALYNENHAHLVNDDRPLQSLNKRTVLTSKKPSAE